MSIEKELEAERQLAQELVDYVGMWVAVRDHHVVASSRSLAKLLEQANLHEDVTGVFQVFEGPCFFGLAA